MESLLYPMVPSAPETLTALRAALGYFLPSGSAAALQMTPKTPEFTFQEEAERMQAAAIVRQQEFLGGRQCARAALQKLGFEPVAIINDTDGVPQWPDAALGSISHTRGLCGAVVGSGEVFQALGFDLERTDRLSPGALRRVMHPQERARYGESQQVGSLLFSAKEAFFKAQYPRFRGQPGFHDLQFKLDLAANCLEVSEESTLPEALQRAATRMAFRFHMVDSVVMTLCAL